MWTRFFDMASGGGKKEPPYQYIYIEATEEKAKTIFYNRFGHNPERVSCACCGSDYVIYEHASLEEATEYDRSSGFGKSKSKTLKSFKGREDVLIIYKKDIKRGEASGNIPKSGWVYID